MEKRPLTVNLSLEEFEKLETICKEFNVKKSTLFKVCFDFIYQKEIAKKQWPLDGFMEKYHIPAHTLGKITNTCYKEIDYSIMHEYFGGNNDG